MSEQNWYSHKGWTVQSSIALELDLALTAVGGGDIFSDKVVGELTFPKKIADDWRAGWSQMLGEPRGSMSLIEPAARMAGVLFGDDYEQTTLAIRELTLTAALARTEQQAAEYELVANPLLPVPERLVDLASRLDIAVSTSVGLIPSVPHQHALRKDIERLVRILHDGDLHARFWLWLDRFYFEFYRPWRETRAPMMEALKKRAVAALGAAEKQGVAPDLSWLSPQNGVLRHPEIRTAIEAGRFFVCFWVEPMGLFDAIATSPGLLITSFAEPDSLHLFEDLSKDLAARANALSDPTRLMILRLIRHFGMINTEIAEYLQIARPTVSVHARILREAGLIRSRQQGRQVRHELLPAELQRLFRDLERYLDLRDED